MYEFRKLMISDISDLRKLYFQEEGIDIDIMKIDAYEERVKSVYEKMLLYGSYIYGCFDKISGNLIGSITVNKCLDCYPNYTNNPYVHLETFIVHKDYQNKGVGQNLLINVLKVIKEEGCTYIIMQSNNHAVQHIARKVGLVDSLSDFRIDFVNSEN